jgi:azurin
MINQVQLTVAALLLTALAAFAGEVAIERSGNTQMQYSTRAFEAATGDTVTLTFKNIGSLPVNVMGHNLVILKKDIDKQPFAMAAMQAKATDYIPETLKDQVLVATRILGPGEEQVLTFTAPEPGDYPFLCSFPGHFAIMSGVFTVTP